MEFGCRHGGSKAAELCATKDRVFWGSLGDEYGGEPTASGRAAPATASAAFRVTCAALEDGEVFLSSSLSRFCGLREGGAPLSGVLTKIEGVSVPEPSNSTTRLDLVLRII